MTTYCRDSLGPPARPIVSTANAPPGSVNRNRPRSRILLSSPTWRPRIDPARIGAAGHSSGGYAALASAGARYAPLQMAADCASAADAPDCSLAKAADISRIDLSAAGKSYRDERVRAVLPMAPAFGPGIVETSLEAVTIPLYIFAAKDDEVLDLARHAKRYHRHIPGSGLQLLSRAAPPTLSFPRMPQ